MATFNGTNGTDLFLIQENLGQLTITLVNPYSGESIYIDEEKNINGDIYHGFGGDDVMVMTNFGDAIFIANAMRQQMGGSRTNRGDRARGGGPGGGDGASGRRRYRDGR